MTTIPITPIEPEVVQELRDTERDYPGYLREFLGLMHEGKIDGGHFYPISGCGCFYGWLSKLHREEWNGLEVIRERVTGDQEIFTLLEELLLPVDRGNTPTTSEILAGLEQAILEIVGEHS